MQRRIMFVSSSRRAWADAPDCASHYAAAPYSIDAIGYNLEKRGWAVAWAGWGGAHRPLRLARAIDAFRPDIVYTYGAALSLHPLLCRRFLCRHKAFSVVHGWDDEYGVIWGDLAGWPGRVAMNIMERLIVTRSDAVVTLSRFLQEKGRALGVECHYIPNGADPVDRAAALVAPGPALEGDFKIVYTGDKARWKHTEELCAAMRDAPPGARLYLTGHDEPYLAKYASENCVFLGFLPKPAQLHVMAQADAFAVTADQDCNAKLQEYLRWGRPILARDGRPNLFFRNGRNALLVRDWAAGIRRLASDPAFCAELVRNAAADIPVFSWAEIAERFEEFFLSLPRREAGSRRVFS